VADVSVALAVHALACMCTSWARLGFTFLVHVVHQTIEAGVHSTQGSVEKLVGKVVHGGEGQR
jgi:hypothetical protein